MSDRKLNLEAMKLSPHRRAKLAEKLLSSLDDESRKSLDVAWGKECEKRLDALSAGKASARPLSQVLGKLKSRRRA